MARGKTTLLKTISGVMDPEKGTIRMDGTDIQSLDPDAIVRRGIVHVPEGREIFPLMTVAENIAMGAYTRKDRSTISDDEEMVYSYFPILKDRRGPNVLALCRVGNNRCWPSGAG